MQVSTQKRGSGIGKCTVVGGLVDQNLGHVHEER